MCVRLTVTEEELHNGERDAIQPTAWSQRFSGCAMIDTRLLFNELIDTVVYLCLAVICTRLRGDFGGVFLPILLRVGLEGEIK